MRHKIKILLADDDEDDRELFEEALNKVNKDHELITVINGEKAIDFLNSSDQAPDFIFLDINMPKKNGIECLKYIKSNYPSQRSHVIMLSTSSAQAAVESSYTHGASLYIQKPSRFDDLVKYLAFCLNSLHGPATPEDFILNQRQSIH